MVLQVGYSSVLERSRAGGGVSTGHPPHRMPRLQGDGPTGMVQFCPREERGRRESLYRAPPSPYATTAGRWSYRCGTVLSLERGGAGGRVYRAPHSRYATTAGRWSYRYGTVLSLERGGAGGRVSTGHPLHRLPRLQGDGPTGMVQFCPREERGRRESLYRAPPTSSATIAGRWSYRYGTVLSLEKGGESLFFNILLFIFFVQMFT
jgi:hypothetical protein